MNNKISTSAKILVYQSENCDILIEYLRSYGFSVIPSTSQDITNKIKDNNYDLLILDHYKTGLLGNLTLLKSLRKLDLKVPAIMVSSESQHKYIIEAFDNGIDDYVAKPYNLEELIRRIMAVLKRCGIKTRTVEPVYKIGKYIFDTEKDNLSIGETQIKLTNKESKILSLLCAYKNEILPRKTLLCQIWTDDNYYNKRSLDVHMCLLRNYLKMDKRISIETKRSIGYSLVIKEE